MKTKILISAGELSGDMLAADLISELKGFKSDIEFFGLVGPNMREMGVVPVANYSDLAVMGPIDALKLYPKIKITEANLLEMSKRLRPDLAILIDYPGFHFILAEKLKLLGIEVYQYVAPKLWAWGKSRVHRLKRDFSLVMGVLPFEENFFLENNVNYKYVGSPHYSRIKNSGLLEYKNTKVLEGSKLVAVLAGSRPSEFKWMLEMLADLHQNKNSNITSIQYVVPIAPSIPKEYAIKIISSNFSKVIENPFTHSLAHSLCSLSLNESIHFEGVSFVWGNSLEWLALSDAALLASGTITLEAALLKTPSVVLYKMDSLSYEIAKAHITVEFIALPNLLLNFEFFDEVIQNLNSHEISRSLDNCLDNPDKFKDGFDKIEMQLSNSEMKAATIIMEKISAEYRQ